jgi:hypothetical protein
VRIPRTQALGVVGISLLGLWSLLQAAFQLSFYLRIALDPESSSWPAWPDLLPTTIYGLLGGGLLLLRYPLAGALFVRDEDLEIEDADGRRLQDFLIAMLGLWIVIRGIVSAAQTEAVLLQQLASQSRPGFGDPINILSSGRAWVERLPALLEIILGSLLFLRSGGVARLWRLFREAGRRRP